MSLKKRERKAKAITFLNINAAGGISYNKDEAVVEVMSSSRQGGGGGGVGGNKKQRQGKEVTSSPAEGDTLCKNQSVAGVNGLL